MKLVYFVDRFGDRVHIRVDWQQMVFFAGAQPAYEGYVTVESPDIPSAAPEKVLAWMRGLTPGHDEARDVIELPEGSWRGAVLDDFIDAQNAAWSVWQLTRATPLERFVDFTERWSPEVLAKAKRVFAATSDRAKLRALDELTELATTVMAVEARLPERARVEHRELEQRIDAARVREIEGQGIEAWIALGGRLKHDIVAANFACVLARRIRNEASSDEEFTRLLELVHGNVGLRLRTTHLPPFWASLAPRLRFSANVKNETIDLGKAIEQPVPASWDLYRARRVGNIAPLRTALVIPGEPTTFVRAERKMLFAITQAGGSLRRYGCTLTVKGSVASNLQAALLEAERIDALAHLSPETLRPEIDKLGLPPGDDAYRALGQIRDDPRQARVLADLLIERIVGIDADVARAHARAQGSRNRR